MTYVTRTSQFYQPRPNPRPSEKDLSPAPTQKNFDHTIRTDCDNDTSHPYYAAVYIVNNPSVVIATLNNIILQPDRLYNATPTKKYTLFALLSHCILIILLFKRAK